MNPLLNYASFEASKKLFEAGIVLETEFYWVEREDWSHPNLGEREDWSHTNLDGSSKNVMTIDTKDDCDEFAIPAPNFGDVLRELPAGMSLHKIDGHYIGYMLEYTPSCFRSGNAQFKTYNKNPIDALADLLLWVGKEKK
jgi:hypothetical protein